MYLALTQTSLMSLPVSIQSFILDIGPILLVSFSLSLFLFLNWYFAYDRIKQKKEKRLWLTRNMRSLVRYGDLMEQLEHLGQTTPVCKQCNNFKMQLWNHQHDELLVVRCRSCKINYTLTKDHSDCTRLILSNMEWAIELINILIKNRHKALGKFLIRKLALDPSCIKPGINPLEVFCFSAKKEDEFIIDPVFEIVLNEWEEVLPLGDYGIRTHVA